MSPRTKIALAISLLITASLSCQYLPAPETDSGDAIATSVAATLTAGEGEESAPETTGTTPEPIPPTPAVLKAVYIKDGNLFYWEEGLLPAPIGAVGDAFDAGLSDDGTLVAFTRGPDYYSQELWAVNVDGSGLRQLVGLSTLSTYITQPDAVSARVYQFDFVPGTHQIAFTTQLTFEGPGLFLNDDLRVVDADTSTLTTVLAPGSGGNFYYSPDGSQIGLSTPTQVSVVDASGGSRQDLLAFPAVITYSEYQYYPPLFWTPDGSAIRVVIPPEDPLAPSPDVTRVWHLPADGSASANIMSMAAVPFFQHTPALSRDTSRVAYLVEITPGSPPVVELHLANADGSGDMIYATGDLRFFGWSADGEHFLYTDGTANPKIGEYGAAPTSLAGVTNLIKVEWIDANRFFFQDKPGADFRLWVGEIGLPPILLDSTPNGMFSIDHNY